MPPAPADHRVLMLTYHFPPMGGAGVQRSSKFVRYLPDFGYRPVVIASPGAATDRFTPHDAPLAQSLPPGTEVHRVPGPEPPISGGRRRRAERWAGLPSPFGRWWTAGARELGLRVGREADVNLVYASIMPFESGIAGVEVARGLGRPLVVDLRDAWAIDELQVYPSAVHRAIEARRMRLVLNAADAVVMNTREAARRVVERFPELAEKRVLAIGNGFDAGEFAGPLPERADAAFRIVHTGMLYTELGFRHERSMMVRRLLRGASPDLNILGRSPVYLYRALDRLLAEDPTARALCGGAPRGCPLRGRSRGQPRLRGGGAAPPLPLARRVDRPHPLGRPPLPADAPAAAGRRVEHDAGQGLRVHGLRAADPRRGAPGRRP